MATQTPLPIEIIPLQYADIPTVSRNTASAFAVDPHTLVKQLGKGGYDMCAISSSGFLGSLGKKNYMHFKAVDPANPGEILGHISWAFRGVSAEELDKMRHRQGLGDQLPPPTTKATNTVVTATAENENTTAAAGDDEATNNDKIQRLHDLEDEDMQAWMSSIPPGACIFVTGLIVAPGYQSRGVGSRLLEKLNETADAMGLCAWVHSSHQAYRAYRKAGFEVTRVLELDLDEWATRGPRDDEAVMGDLGLNCLDGTQGGASQASELRGNGLEGGQGQRRWGRYIIRYLKREPQSPSSGI